MTFLLTQPWPWLVMGIVCVVLGLVNIGLSPKEWIAYLVSLPFILVTEDTEDEKQRHTQSSDEMVAASPGCSLLIIGTLCLSYGLFRLVT